jgi:hypothetical protein
LEVPMKEKIYEQISKELKLAAQVDMKIVITDIVVSLILFFLAMGFADGTVGGVSLSLTGGISHSHNTLNTVPTIVMFVLLVVILVMNYYAVKMLVNNQKQRAKLNEGLMKLYKDEGVDQYYDGSIFKGYESRYNLFAIFAGAIGAMGIIVPLVIFINNLTKL